MYKSLIRPLLFLCSPELIHRLVAFAIPVCFSIPGISWLTRKFYQVNDPRLKRTVFGIDFPNPVGIAAGFDKKARLYNSLSHFGFGHIEIGTVTPRGQKGNPKPRLFRIPKDHALINRMGFNNQGAITFRNNIIRQGKKVIIGGNIGKNTDTPNENAVADYCYCFEELFDLVDYFVVNVSCPNIKDLSKLQNKDSLLSLFHALQQINRSKSRKKPLLIKISPDLSNAQLDEIIEVVRATGLDGIVAANTSTRREGLRTSPEKIENIGQGGLSGKPLRDKSTKVIAYLHKQSNGEIPIIGIGGIQQPKDAIDKIKAGASLVQVYTGFIYTGPSIARKINKEILAQLTS